MNDREFWARRLHSLSGVVPIGAFLVEHMLTNSRALHGKAAYNEAVEWISNLPYLLWMEIFLIGLPIVFHAVYGVYIAVKAKPNPVQYPYFRNWMYTFQRASGMLLLAYITWHVWGTRVAKIYNPAIASNFFDFMAANFHNPFYLGFQILGVIAAAFHFANGLWTFLIVWGVAVGPRAQRLASVVCYGIGAVILMFGFDSFRGFLQAGGS